MSLFFGKISTPGSAVTASLPQGYSVLQLQLLQLAKRVLELAAMSNQEQFSFESFTLILKMDLFFFHFVNN